MPVTYDRPADELRPMPGGIITRSPEFIARGRGARLFSDVKGPALRQLATSHRDAARQAASALLEVARARSVLPSGSDTRR